MSGWYQWQDQTLILRLRLQPGARHNAILGPYGENSLRISIKAPPVDGKANTLLLRFIAECFDVTPRQVRLLGGAHSRDKRIAIDRPGRLPGETRIPALD